MRRIADVFMATFVYHTTPAGGDGCLFVNRAPAMCGGIKRQRIDQEATNAPPDAPCRTSRQQCWQSVPCVRRRTYRHPCEPNAAACSGAAAALRVALAQLSASNAPPTPPQRPPTSVPQASKRSAALGVNRLDRGVLCMQVETETWFDSMLRVCCSPEPQSTTTGALCANGRGGRE